MAGRPPHQGVPRRDRDIGPGDIGHLTSRGVERRAIFHDDDDRRRFEHLVMAAAREKRVLCLDYCLMDTHYHLVVEALDEPLGTVMRDVLGDYVQAFNARHVRDGHLFERRFWSKKVASRRHLHALARYIAQNPTKAGLCGHPAAWPWSGYRELTGAKPPTVTAVDAYLARFGPDAESGRVAYSRLATATADAKDFALTELACAFTTEWRREAVAAAHAAGCSRPTIADAAGCSLRTVERHLRDKGV